MYSGSHNVSHPDRRGDGGRAPHRKRPVAQTWVGRPEEQRTMDQTTTSTASSTATIAAPQTTTTWAIDPSHSEVGFAVKHMMVSSTKGRFAEFGGAITLDEADLSRSRVDVEIAVAS